MVSAAVARADVVITTANVPGRKRPGSSRRRRWPR